MREIFEKVRFIALEGWTWNRIRTLGMFENLEKLTFINDDENSRWLETLRRLIKTRTGATGTTNGHPGEQQVEVFEGNGLSLQDFHAEFPDHYTSR